MTHPISGTELDTDMRGNVQAFFPPRTVQPYCALLYRLYAWAYLCRGLRFTGKVPRYDLSQAAVREKKKKAAAAALVQTAVKLFPKGEGEKTLCRQ